MTDRVETLRNLMRRAHHGIMRARGAGGQLSRHCYKVTLKVPGLLTDMQIDGIDVQDLLVPDVKVPEAERISAVETVIPHLGSKVLTAQTRAELRALLGRLALDFMLCGETPEERLARLLWVLGKHTRREVGDQTLVVHDASGEYGVRDGVMVGSIYAGTPLILPMEKILQRTVVKITRSAHMSEVQRILLRKEDPTTHNIFCLLYAISEWDDSVIIRSLLMPGARKLQRNLTKLATTLLTHHDPYRVLFRALCPYHMPYAEYLAIFGKPDKRGNIGNAARNRLINKLYQLPLFD